MMELELAFIDADEDITYEDLEGEVCVLCGEIITREEWSEDWIVPWFSDEEDTDDDSVLWIHEDCYEDSDVWDEYLTDKLIKEESIKATRI